MGQVVAKLAGLVIVVACCWWAASAERSRAAENWLVWGAPLAVFPVSYAGRKALDARPTAAHASRTNIAVHYAVGSALGMGIFPAFRRLLAEDVIHTPWVRQAAGALVIVTGAATALTVVNLAWRGLGLPFAVKLSSRLATDWMYGWTRNPMGLCAACWFASIGLERGSVWFLVWLATSVSPGWIFFAKVYEERELELRFGQSYVEYRRRTPMFLPRKPRESARRTECRAAHNRAATRVVLRSIQVYTTRNSELVSPAGEASVGGTEFWTRLRLFGAQWFGRPRFESTRREISR